ncbi:penicillin acylase family protein [Algoriphagus sp. AK58]|uniref:penicillin acylase family protein n=1 Tax=Algoriphagus sp. AK58 TaxID=1406877 RepID=UPI001650BBDB|nr:penicillin acylase family protein [Algoriphagus sp. AK58]MBC6366991.1 penicillin acylase family protein [Algoriphagus sp. AK58]
MKQILLAGWTGFLILASLTVFSQNLSIHGLHQPVEVYRDSSGINHIFAQNEHDLFFSQGYLAAKDRLFQFELWRRQATGTLAEILGERELDRDRGARLFRFRGDKNKELNHYHPRGEQIVDAFVAGVNQYILEARNTPESLPIEFKMLQILPEFWTWEVVISRHQGLLGNSPEELNISRIVSLIGEEETKKLFHFHPNEPDLNLDPSIPKELLFKNILQPYQAFRAAVVFKPEDIQPEFRKNQAEFEKTLAEWKAETDFNLEADAFAMGSNNWVVSGSKTESGFPFMANDPHRLQAVPSLRYWVHLNAPGWNVIGGGEPVIPGISIGHNDHGAWGLTIFSTDFEDIRVYDLHPEDSEKYWHKGQWHSFQLIRDSIQVKGKGKIPVIHRFSVHGPVTFIDHELKKAVALECAWLEYGGAPYLASLSMNQAKTWEEFQAACTLNHVPAENMIWADRQGNIGWQATGIPPIRKEFSGLVATPGDGSKEWEGYLPISKRPSSVNPTKGFIATANENVTPREYPFPEALGFEWADDFRGKRIAEVLSQDRKFTLEEMGRLQNDYLALPARTLVPFLRTLSFSDPQADSLRRTLLTWDFRLEKNSIQAGIYVMWERDLRSRISDLVVPKEVAPYFGNASLTLILDWMENPEKIFASNPEKARDEVLQKSFENAMATLRVKLGEDVNNWQYGQAAYKHALIRHPLSAAVNDDWEKKLNHGPLPRGGYSFTPAANAYGDNNSSGASFRILVDTQDWEKTQGINTPGQSGNPESPFYSNLFPIWANDGFFPVHFEKSKIQKSAFEKSVLQPASQGN